MAYPDVSNRETWPIPLRPSSSAAQAASPAPSEVIVPTPVMTTVLRPSAPMRTPARRGAAAPAAPSSKVGVAAPATPSSKVASMVFAISAQLARFKTWRVWSPVSDV